MPAIQSLLAPKLVTQTPYHKWLFWGQHINLTGLHVHMVFSMQPQCIHNLYLVVSVYYQIECVRMHKYKHFV